MEEKIVNKITQSGLITIDLEELYPVGKRMTLDIAPWLYEGVMLREKEFRAHVAGHDWQQYRDAYVALHCSVDAIIPQWAWLLAGNALAQHARRTVYGSQEVLESILFEKIIDALNPEDYRDQRVIVKGCSKVPVPMQAYVRLTEMLTPVVKSLMYGEACSTVPVYKRRTEK